MKKTSTPKTSTLNVSRCLCFRIVFLVLLSVGTSHLYSQTVVNSLAALRSAVQQNNQTIVMQPGNYNMDDLSSDERNIICSGSNNDIDLTGVHITCTVGSVSDRYIIISGNNNTFRGMELEDVYSNGMTEVTDFSAYNQNRTNLARGIRGAPDMHVSGDGNLVIDVKLTVRGSYPYGYGSMYGVGSNNVYGLDKRCGLLITGSDNIVDSCEVQQMAFGHGLYLQGDADDNLIKNTLVEGKVRNYSELYNETNTFDLPYRSDYKLPLADNAPIPMNQVFSLCEDGIRMYNGTKSVTVENCTTKRMRSGIRLYLAEGGTTTDSYAIDNESTNFNLPAGGTITNSSGNFGYGPISDFRLGRNNQDIELTIIPSPNAIGPHNIADVQGNGHNIVFHRSPGPLDNTTRAIVVTGNNSTIVNETEYRIILESGTSGNTIISCGPVTDNGSGNSVSSSSNCNISCGDFDAFSTIEAESFCDMFGIQTEACSEGGLNVGYIHSGDWIRFDDVDFGNGTDSVDVRVASKSSGGTIEFRLGSTSGTLIGTATVPVTGDWQVWETVSADVNDISGTHDLFLVFPDSGINLNWFEFFASSSNGGTNIALNGSASQSSTNHSGDASRAIDNNTNGKWTVGSVTHTTSESPAWWQLDLGASYDIGQIVIWGRTDSCCQSRLSNYDVDILDSNYNLVWTNYQSSYPNPSTSINANATTGRYVLIELRDTNPLSLAEVQVFGTPSTTPTSSEFALVKRDATGFVINGGSGGANGQVVSLWSNIVHDNLTWEEIDRGGGYYSYQKKNTNYSLDGGDGGSDGQPIYLWTTDANNYNQHWRKVDSGGGFYRLEKRNAPGYSIDGGNGGAKRQAIFLWSSDSNNQSQEWRFDER
ncbi:carbohydrate-binding protein [Puniceicoccaceae bacterium K14]|nr:carbohydrate-binding protein [Puniceicoccaceae bacterium K14]